MAKKVVIVGGGFGGVTIAKDIADANSNLEVTLISRSPYFTYIPSLHEVVSGKVSENSITFDLKDFMHKNKGTFVHDTIKDIDLANKVVQGEKKYPYDYLVLATGSITHFYGIEHNGAPLYELKTLADAVKVKKRILDLIDDKKKRIIHIVGGGATGVELAGEIADYVVQKKTQDSIQINIIEAQERLLPQCNEEVSEYAQKHLEKIGVNIMTLSLIQRLSKTKIITNGGEVATDMIIWTAGIRVAPLMDKVDLPKNRGKLCVSPYLNSPHDQSVFSVGDTIYYHDPVNDRIAVATAKKAIEGAHIVAQNIINLSSGLTLTPWRLSKNPFLISIGDKTTIFTWEGWKEFYLGGVVPAYAKKQVERKVMNSLKS